MPLQWVGFFHPAKVYTGWLPWIVRRSEGAADCRPAVSRSPTPHQTCTSSQPPLSHSTHPPSLFRRSSTPCGLPTCGTTSTRCVRTRRWRWATQVRLAGWGAQQLLSSCAAEPACSKGNLPAAKGALFRGLSRISASAHQAPAPHPCPAVRAYGDEAVQRILEHVRPCWIECKDAAAAAAWTSVS